MVLRNDGLEVVRLGGGIRGFFSGGGFGGFGGFTFVGNAIVRREGILTKNERRKTRYNGDGNDF